jgi:hypothetical protein
MEREEDSLQERGGLGQLLGFGRCVHLAFSKDLSTDILCRRHMRRITLASYC